MLTVGFEAASRVPFTQCQFPVYIETPYRLLLHVIRWSGRANLLAPRFGWLESPVDVSDKQRAIAPNQIWRDLTFRLLDPLALSESFIKPRSKGRGFFLPKPVSQLLKLGGLLAG